MLDNRSLEKQGLIVIFFFLAFGLILFVSCFLPWCLTFNLLSKISMAICCFGIAIMFIIARKIDH